MLIEMEKFLIETYIGAGKIKFGMTPSEVHSILGREFRSFKRNVEDPYPCEHFTNCQCFVYYDKNQKVDSIEFAEPAKPVLNGINLLGYGFSELTKKIVAMDPEVTIESDGFTSRKLGVGGWAPNAEDEPDLPPESIIVFARGYYD